MFSIDTIKNKKIVIIKILNPNTCKIKLRNDNLIYLIDNEVVNQISMYSVLAIFIIGETYITTPLIKKAMACGTSIILMNNNLSHLANISPLIEGNFLLRQKQYNTTKADELIIAKELVKLKITNQLKLVGMKANKIKLVLSKLPSIATFQELNGFEGTIAKQYFSFHFGDNWQGRRPRVKDTIDNYLLDLGYTLLLNYIDVNLRLFGFDTYKGVYHQLFFNRKSLSCDIMEPFRPMIDNRIKTASNLKIINSKDFVLNAYKEYYLPFDKQSKYNNLFFELMVDNKENIFEFIMGYYRYFMNMDKNKFPKFKQK